MNIKTLTWVKRIEPISDESLAGFVGRWARDNVFYSRVNLLTAIGVSPAIRVFPADVISLSKSLGVDLALLESIAPSTKAHVVHPSGLGTQIDFDVAQGLPVGQLRKGHGEELIQAREVFGLMFVPMIGLTASKRAQGQIQPELRKYELALVHDGFGRKPAKNRQSGFRRSNRDQTETPNLISKSLTYDVLMCKRWDTTDSVNTFTWRPFCEPVRKFVCKAYLYAQSTTPLRKLCKSPPAVCLM